MHSNWIWLVVLLVAWCPLVLCSATSSCARFTFTGGTFYCTHNTQVGSICSFRCYPDYRLVGRNLSVCLRKKNSNPHWSHEIPYCIVYRSPELIAYFIFGVLGGFLIIVFGTGLALFCTSFCCRGDVERSINHTEASPEGKPEATVDFEASLGEESSSTQRDGTANGDSEHHNESM